ncbi:MAG: hypothetical protein ACREXU_06965 [Gammaproteobacteria bacterium]
MMVELGLVDVTPGAQAALEEAEQSADEFVLRHGNGDWGELGTAEVRDNQTSLKEGFRIFSAYTLSTGVRIWVFTEDDRSMTTVLLPEEFHLTASSGGAEPMRGWSRTWRR